MQQFATGWVAALGADIDFQLGWIPDRVEFFNITDGNKLNVGFPSVKKMAYTSGGTNEIKVGHTLIGATSGARALVVGVTLASNTWAGGDATGHFLLDADSEVGTFSSESVYYEGSSGTNDASGAATTDSGYDIDTDTATQTNISAYKGTEAANSKGFTVAAAIATTAKIFVWSAWRSVSS